MLSFRARGNTSRKKLVKTVKDHGGRVGQHVKAIQGILSAFPGAYITSPVLTSYLHRKKNFHHRSYAVSGSTLGLWFRTEEDRQKGIDAFYKNVQLSYLVEFVHTEVGTPEVIVPKHIGFTAGCMWFEMHPSKGVVLYGIPRALKNNKNAVFNVADGANPLIAVIEYMKFRHTCVQMDPFYSPWFPLTLESLKKITDTVGEFSFGVPSRVEELFSGDTENTMNVIHRSYAQLWKVGEYAPSEVHIPLFANLVKHNAVVKDFRKNNFDGHDAPLKSAVHDIRRLLLAQGCNISFLRIDRVVRELFAFDLKEKDDAGLVSSLIVADILYAMLHECQNSGRDALRAIDFVEEIGLLPDEKKPSMWDIYTSWKDGCEYWELGPSLASLFIERVPAGGFLHDKCNKESPAFGGLRSLSPRYLFRLRGREYQEIERELGCELQ